LKDDVSFPIKLTSLLANEKRRFPEARWYVFGSASRVKQGVVNDLDLLIVYPDSCFVQACELIDRMSGIHFLDGLPIDLTTLSETEERQVSFIDRESARRIA
jgi:predicted nucleotidyltransferase